MQPRACASRKLAGSDVVDTTSDEGLPSILNILPRLCHPDAVRLCCSRLHVPDACKNGPQDLDQGELHGTYKRTRRHVPRSQTEAHHTQLNTGAKIPAVGLGTWQSKPGEVREAVKAALQGGYRHIDTALAYGNEKEVGEGIKDSGVPREDIWVTTKLDNPWHKRVDEGINSSLKSLGLDYVDLYLMVSLLASMA